MRHSDDEVGRHEHMNKLVSPRRRCLLFFSIHKKTLSRGVWAVRKEKSGTANFDAVLKIYSLQKRDAGMCLVWKRVFPLQWCAMLIQTHIGPTISRVCRNRFNGNERKGNQIDGGSPKHLTHTNSKYLVR